MAIVLVLCVLAVQLTPTEAWMSTIRQLKRSATGRPHHVWRRTEIALTKQPFASISSVSSRHQPSPSDTHSTSPLSTSKQTQEPDLFEILADVKHTPKLIVFDLDNTLWTPELYQIRQRNTPIANQEIRLFDHVAEIIAFCKASGFTMGIASRTNKVQWAHQLLKDFTILDPTTQTDKPLATFFDLVEIQPGSKKTHFSNMRKASGLTYSDMIFFDDDARMNLQEISSQLGVFCVHTPHGITRQHFYNSMLAYNQRKINQQEWMGEIWEHSASNPAIKGATTCQGRVKFYSSQKRFGFVVDNATGNEYFVHESKVPTGVQLSAGDPVTFEALASDSRGRASAVVVSGGGRGAAATAAAAVPIAPSSALTDNGASTGRVSMPCFTMSQPFCALLLNGVKTVESRNNPMFLDVKPGTQLLLHCGQKDWHDTASYKDILASEMSAHALHEASVLPENFSRGAIVGVVTIGKTWRASDGEMRGSELQRKILAPYDGIGKFCTEIIACRWLEKPLKVRGQPGVYSVAVPSDFLQE